mmetsp:Transcript_10532/g.34645  ORF Transcript_10532/g.34645 Transcript_10532/m.34645 type:complete len:220 (-) Transcript_10532:58-717(-)
MGLEAARGAAHNVADACARTGAGGGSLHADDGSRAAPPRAHGLGSRQVQRKGHRVCGVPLRPELHYDPRQEPLPGAVRVAPRRAARARQSAGRVPHPAGGQAARVAHGRRRPGGHARGDLLRRDAGGGRQGARGEQVALARLLHRLWPHRLRASPPAARPLRAGRAEAEDVPPHARRRPGAARARAHQPQSRVNRSRELFRSHVHSLQRTRGADRVDHP